MNYLIISDIHGSHQRLQDVLKTPHSFDAILLIGDLMYHGPRNPILEDYNPAAVANLLNDLSLPIMAVRGNCDSEVDQMLINFPILADYTLLSYEDYLIYITHGHVIDPKDASQTKADIFISGHTHLPGFKQVNKTLCVNPGSIALPKEGHPNSYAILSPHYITIYDLNHEVYLKHEI